MRYATDDGVVLPGPTATDAVDQLRANSRSPTTSRKAFRTEVAERVEQDGLLISVINDEQFIADLVQAGFLKELAEDN